MHNGNRKNTKADTDYMQVLNVAYHKAHGIYLNHQKNPANAELNKQFKVICKEYTDLLEKYKIDLSWVYTNHFGMWEYHPDWEKAVTYITEELKKLKNIESKINFLNDTKATIIKKDIERVGNKEPIGSTLFRGYIDNKIEQFNELKNIENPDKKPIEKLERNISEGISNSRKFIEIMGSSKQSKGADVKTGASDKIQWQGTAGQLVYLFEQLGDSNFLPLATDLQATIRRHFVDKNGKPFTTLRQSKQNYLNTKTSKPKQAEAIESIVSKLKK